MAALRILIADDHAAVRREVRSLLESHPEWDVCAEATNGREAVEQTVRLQPDVVLLDISMPELNGLEAARQIRDAVPDAWVIVLTMHRSDQLAEEVRRAGGHGVVYKSDAHETLIRVIESLRARAAIHVAGSVVDGGRHIGAFFHSKQERYRVLAPFIAEGLAAGEKVVHFIDPRDRALDVRHLGDAGIDVDRAERRGQLMLLPWEDALLTDGRFERMPVLLEEVLGSASTEGYPLVRLIGHMEWALEGRPVPRDLLAFESGLNNLLPRYSNVAICTYDLTKFSGAMVIDALRTHPAVIVAGSLHLNPFYAPPDRILEELREQ